MYNSEFREPKKEGKKNCGGKEMEEKFEGQKEAGKTLEVKK